jgi:hypothetical protein
MAFANHLLDPTSFCKCTCFTNSTIIPLDSKDGTSRPGGDFDGDGDEHKDLKARTCNDCTKSFCLSYNLPICKDASGKEAPEHEVFTMCFQRDSTKDQVVIYMFILATVGLLAWAIMKPFVGTLREKTRARQIYAPVDTGSGQ